MEKLEKIFYRFINHYLKTGKKTNLFIYNKLNKRYKTKYSNYLMHIENNNWKLCIRITKDLKELQVKDVLLDSERQYVFKEKDFEKEINYLHKNILLSRKDIIKRINFEYGICNFDYNDSIIDKVPLKLWCKKMTKIPLNTRLIYLFKENFE